MKRKKPVPQTEAVQAAPVPAAVQKENPYLDTVAVVLFSLLLLVGMTVQTGKVSIILMAAALLLSLGRGPLRRFRERFCVPVLGLWAYALMNGLAAVYSPFGDSAVPEFYKLAASFSVAAVLLARFDKRHVRGLLWGFAAVSAVIGLLCLDAAGNGAVFQAFNSLIERAGFSYSDIPQDSSGRLVGLYNDANVSGCILALGALVSLYLIHTEEKRWLRLVSCLLLGINAQVFFLSMSRGAILCFGLALVVWLAAEGKEGRLRLFFLMFLSAVVTVGFSVVIMPMLGRATIQPLALTLVSGLVIFPLDLLLSGRLAGLLAGRGKVVAVVLGGVAVLCGVYVFVAFQVVGPYTFGTGHARFLTRSVVVPAGTYTVVGDWDGGRAVGANIYTRTPTQALMNKATGLGDIPLEDHNFELKEESKVFLTLYGAEGDQIRWVALSDGTQEYEVPLVYKLMPSVLASRLHEGLFGSYSFLVRVQFMKDAWKIFLTRPIIGHGLGATEGLYTSVQPFFYESLYVHNHLLQAMTDMGLFGLASLLSVVGGSLWLILRRLREERDPLAAALLACWVLLNVHSLMEINFSIRAFQCTAWFLLLLPVLLWGKPLAAGERALKLGGWFLGVALWLFLLVFGGLLISHRMVVQEASEFSTSSAQEFLDKLRDFTRRDVFDHESYQLEYVAAVATVNDSRYNRERLQYVEEMRKSGTYTACSGLARYYYLPRGELEQLFECSREGVAQEASTNEAWNLQLNFYRNEVLPAAGVEHMDVFMGGVLALDGFLQEWSEGRLEEIQLSEENQIFLERVRDGHAQGLPAEAMYLYLSGAFDVAPEPAAE